MRCAAILGLSLLAAPLGADWKVTIVSTDQQNRSVETEYYKSGLQRSDQIDPATGDLRGASVLDRAGNRYISWDTQKREYSIQRPRTRLEATESGPAIIFDIESTDTGERRSMFGREVLRVITVERRHTEGGPIESEARTDGWYFESNSLPPGMRPRTAALFTTVDAHHPPPAIRINHHGLVEKGLPVSTTTTTVSTMRNGQRQSWQHTSQVTELFEGQLDAALFEPPTGFRRVYNYYNYVALTWRENLLQYWEWLQDQFE